MRILRRLSPKNWSLAVKLTLAMTILTAVAVTSVTLLSIRRETRTFQTELREQADLLLATLTAAAADPLYLGNVDDLSDLVEGMGRNALSADRQILSSGRIYDATGRIVGDAYDKLIVYNLEPDPFGQQLIESNVTIYNWENDQLVAGRPVLIGQQRLGAVSVGLSTLPLETKVVAVQNQGLVVAIVTIIVGLLLALTLSRSITNPLRALVGLTQRIGEGDLSHQIRLNGNDEVAVLGLAMEQMRVELRRLYGGLEEQVEQRTSELTKTNEQLLQARDQALEASRLKTELLAKVSHELRTPLGAVLGYAEMLKEGLYGEISTQQHEPADNIIESAHYLNNIVNELLDQAKLDAGILELNIDNFILPDVVYQVQAQMKVLAKAKGLDLITEITDDMPTIIEGDVARLQQILVNLIGNAIKFTKFGSVKLTICRFNEAHWMMQVNDTGIGIPSILQEVIFEPFRQVDGSATREQGGSGLGLSIVKQLVELMEGQIFVESKEGQGSTFTIQLPIFTNGLNPENDNADR